jgi:hypothetical protein
MCGDGAADCNEAGRFLNPWFISYIFLQRRMYFVFEFLILFLHQLLQMRSLIDNSIAEMIKEQVFKDLKMLVPLLFRQYCANSASDRHFSVSSASKKSSAHGKSLAVLAFDALESSLVLASSKFGIEEFAEVAAALLDEMDSSSAAAGQDSVLSQGHSVSQSDSNIKISRCIQLLQKEFDTYEGQADYDQAKQILCILNPFYSILHNDYLAQHLVISRKFYLL